MNRMKKDEKQALSKSDRVCRNIIEYGILGLIVFSPLPAASVNEWSIMVIQLVVLVMVAAYIMMREKPETNEIVSYSLKWPKYLFFSLFVFIFIQIIPFPKLMIKVLSPNTYSFQELFQSDFLRVKFMSLSLIPSYTLRQGLEILSYFLLGFLIVKTVTNRRQIMRIFSVLIAMGVFEAFYGLFELYNKNPRILFYRKSYYLDSVTGTFVNRNHLSGYLEMIIPLAIGLIIARIDVFSLAGLKWKEKLLALSKKGVSTNLFITFGIIIMSLAVVFSKSRSGIFILIFSFVLFFGLTSLYLGTAMYQKKGIKSFLQIVFLAIIFISLYVGIEAMFERFAMDNAIVRSGRPTYWADTSRIIADFPVFGTGLGTFSSVAYDYEGDRTPLRLEHAHNDYLEYLSELGVIGMIMLMGGILFMAVSSFLIWRTRKHPEVKGLVLGGMVALICILIHSITDFNLQIPANMLLFSIVLSMTIVTAAYKYRRDAKNSRQE